METEVELARTMSRHTIYIIDNWISISLMMNCSATAITVLSFCLFQNRYLMFSVKGAGAVNSLTGGLTRPLQAKAHIKEEILWTRIKMTKQIIGKTPMNFPRLQTKKTIQTVLSRCSITAKGFSSSDPRWTLRKLKTNKATSSRRANMSFRLLLPFLLATHLHFS